MSTNVCLASDYAVLYCRRYSFYYGYEETVGDLWVFVVKDETGRDVYRKAIDPKGIEWDCTRGLLEGIALFFDEYME